ncbi:hypothetical protein [Dongia deserti]|uniref:hypothetical protein n=1 Tax=Dongia deserti TaxID=2268030 RepID=UPI0013C4B8B4|nr:hypothetical protein [Dongia deserti]
MSEPYRPDTGGHAHGAIRDSFLAAVDAFEAWKAGLAEPEVAFGTDRVPVRISRVLEYMILCTDPLPTGAARQVAKVTGRRLRDDATYGEAAGALLPAVAIRAVRVRLLPATVAA